MKYIKKHADTAVILIGIVAFVLWVNEQISQMNQETQELHKEIVRIQDRCDTIEYMRK